MAVNYLGRIVRGVILDITGVLKESGTDGGTAIVGSVDAIERLCNSGLHIRFCTNETTITRRTLVSQLQKLGFSIDEDKVFPPIPAMCRILQEKGLRPHLLVEANALPDFAGVDQENPNCVVIGDAGHYFTYDNLNKAFQCLMGLKQPLLFSLGKGKYYQDSGQLVLDVGCYTRAIEYATGLSAEIVGKPSPSFFGAVLSDMGLEAQETVMVGDDIVGDVGGAQNCGMTGVLVRTGKYRMPDETHPEVKPHAIVDNLFQFVDELLK